MMSRTNLTRLERRCKSEVDGDRAKELSNKLLQRPPYQHGELGACQGPSLQLHSIMPASIDGGV